MPDKSHFLHLAYLACSYIYKVGANPVSGKLTVDVACIRLHLCHIFRTCGRQRFHSFRILRLVILKFHHTAVVVKRSARNARQHQVGTTGRKVLLQGKSVTLAQIATQHLEERTADEVLVYLVEHLRGELPQVGTQEPYTDPASV